MKQRPLKVIHAAAVRDATGVNARPGAVLVEGGKVLAAGEPDSLPGQLVKQAEVIDRRGHLLLPGLVNAHTHLELSAIGPKRYDPKGGFVGWVRMVRQIDAGALRERKDAAAMGTNLCRTSGVQAVGDIASEASIAITRKNGLLRGRTYVELFGLGPPFDEKALQAVENGIEDLQPHAPYSAGPRLYEAAARTGLPVSTHLAETRDEAEFVTHGQGAWLEYLRSIERWNDAAAASYGRGLSPVQWMRPYLEIAAPDGGWLAAHCNYVSDRDIAILADTNTSVAYCPIASEYFGHTGHRYREMIDAGINVCLGTDSIVCANPDDPQPLGVLSAMRRLFERDQVAPSTLLQMATINGAKALRMVPGCATLQPGAGARFACIAIDLDDARDPLEQILNNDALAEPLWLSDHPDALEFANNEQY